MAVDTRSENVLVPRRILHINQPTALLRLVEKFCASRKFSVDSFESTSVGLHYALARKYHMILLGLPTRGLEANRFLKGLLRAKISIPVLIMSDSHSKEKQELVKFANVLGFLSKPLDINEFSKFLESANKPADLDPEEKEKLTTILRKWEEKNSHAN